jgi:hypothetical protein
MIEIEPEVPRQVRILFMTGGGVLLLGLVMVLVLMGRSPEPSHVTDDDAEPPIQQRYNVDPLRPRAASGPEAHDAGTFSATTQPATRPSTRAK